MGLKSDYLTVDLMNDIQNQFLNIQTALINAGYISPDIVTENIAFDFLPTEIKRLFNQQETNTQKIDAVVDWLNPYSALFDWPKKRGYIFNDINRWWNWAEYNNSIINGEQEKVQYLVDKKGKVITLKTNEPITTYEGYFKEEI